MALDLFLSHVAGACRAHPARAKWVFVGTHATGLTLGDRLARDGCEWANLRFVTPLDVATRMAAPFLVEQGIDPSEETLGPALVMRLFLDLAAGPSYFRPMAEHTSMADALWRTLRELRYAGLRASDLAARSFTGLGAKQAELVALLHAYETHLSTSRLADMPAVFEEAIRHAEWSPVCADDLVIELPGPPWPAVVRRFLDALPGTRLALPAIRLAQTGTRLPPADGEPAGHMPGPTPSAHPAHAASTAQTALPAAQVELFHGGGRDAEIEEVFRRIALSSLPLDQVEIACAAGVSASLLWEKAVRLGWPVTLSAGLPATLTRPGRLLLRFCDWIESGLQAAELRRLLQSGDCSSRGFSCEREAEDLSPGQAARLLLKSGATWGSRTYPAALTRLAEDYERGAANPEASDEDRAWQARKGRQCRVLLSWTSFTLASLPAGAEDPRTVVPLRQLAEAATRFLEINAARAGSPDAVALAATRDALAGLSSLGEYACAVSSALKFLRERVLSLAVGRDRPRPGHLHVSGLHDAGLDGRPLVFVTGLEEGAVFAAAVEDPVLLDEERRALHASLRTSRDRQRDELDLVQMRLASLRESATRLCFSFSCRDTREFRQTFPSWIVLEAYRLQQGDGTLTYRALRKHLGEPVSAVALHATAALTDAAWWLVRSSSRARGAVLDAFPWLGRGSRAALARASDDFGEFDGFVPEAGTALDPSRTGRPVSATTLEDAAKCPLRFFMRHGLGVRPIEEGRLDADAWLPPTTRGSELHALYARLMRSVRAEAREPRLDVDGPRLRAWGETRLRELRDEMPPPSVEVFERESREFLADLDAFITAECDGCHGRGALAFEVPFGFPLEPGEEEPLAGAGPLVIAIEDDRRFVLHGRIDRINRVKPHEYEVADYKGSYWPDDWQGIFAGGTRLQHAIYGAAAEQLLRPIDRTARVVRGTYLFPRATAHRARRVIAAPASSRLKGVLRAIADVIGNGLFAPATEGSPCRWCDYKRACHAADPERMQAKAVGSGSPALEAYRRLRQDYE